jgi:uncharacterized membrane protein
MTEIESTSNAISSSRLTQILRFIAICLTVESLIIAIILRIPLLGVVFILIPWLVISSPVRTKNWELIVSTIILFAIQSAYFYGIRLIMLIGQKENGPNIGMGLITLLLIFCYILAFSIVAIIHQVSLLLAKRYHSWSIEDRQSKMGEPKS